MLLDSDCRQVLLQVRPMHDTEVMSPSTPTLPRWTASTRHQSTCNIHLRLVSASPLSTMTATATPPSLVSDREENERESTNTLALLLPHLALFEPQSLRLLRDHYATFGEIAHWAPVKGFGRVIIVYSSEDEAAFAKRDGDKLFLDVDLGEEEGRKGGGEAFKHKRSKSQPPHG